MKRFFLLMISLITVILLVVSCEKGEKTVRVPLFLVNKDVAKEFPVDKNLVLARALLENPKVSFSDDRLIMDLDYKISLAGNYHPEIEADIYDYCIAFGQEFPEKIKERRKVNL